MAEKISEADAVREFWDKVHEDKTVMLGLNGPEHHTQPMTALAEPATEELWFFTRTDTTLALESIGGVQARLVFMSKGEKVQADIIGTLRVERDVNRIERYWNPMVGAWYPEGKADPHLTLLCFAPERGQVWVASHGAVGTAFEVTKANLTRKMPNIGTSAEVCFRH